MIFKIWELRSKALSRNILFCILMILHVYEVAESLCTNSKIRQSDVIQADVFLLSLLIFIHVENQKFFNSKNGCIYSSSKLWKRKTLSGLITSVWLILEFFTYSATPSDFVKMSQFGTRILRVVALNTRILPVENFSWRCQPYLWSVPENLQFDYFF